jgi:hypothetical protein
VADTERLTAPTLEQFAEAAEVNYVRTPFQRALDSQARFRGFQRLGVELALVRRDGRMEAVAYLLPASLEIPGGLETPEGRVEWVYMFQVAARLEAPGAGALLIRQVMKWYPAILGIGITPDAVRIYQAFKWTHYRDLWRLVHPLRLDRMMEDYGGRLTKPWQRGALSALAGVYNAAGGAIEAAFAAGASCETWKPSADESKALAVAEYLPLYRAGDLTHGLTAVNVGGAGRIGNPPASGLGSLRQHAALWRQMRRDGLKFCEMLIPTEELLQRAKLLGYWPVSLPVWYWDKNGTMTPILKKLGSGMISFLETDKVV